MTNSLRLVLTFVVVGTGVGRLAAQTVDATVNGLVVDRSGAGIAGVTVSASNEHAGATSVVVTDARGRYRMPPLPPAVYTFTAEHHNFRTATRADQPLAVGMTIAVDFTLDLTNTESVEVVAEPNSSISTVTSSRHIARQEIDDLPVVDRNFNALASLAPSVTPTGTYGGVDIAGSRDFQNGYYVDGVSAEALGAGDQRVTYAQDWIQEFQLLTNYYAAEFGRASGGILNAVTRSGSNLTHTRGYGFFRNEEWDATPVFAAAKTPLASKRIGATIGGPIVANRTFYFGGGEWFDHAVTRVVNSSFPQHNGNVPSNSDQKVFIGKVEHYAGGAGNYRFRYNGDRRHATNDGVGGRATEEYGRSIDYSANDAVISWMRPVASSAFNEVRVALTDTLSDSRCNFAERHPEGPWFSLQYPTALLGCHGDGFGRKATKELQLIDVFALTRGSHDLRWGAQLSRDRSSGDYRFVRDGIFRFQREMPFNLNNPASYPFFFVQFQGPTTWNYAWWKSGVFLQDIWRALPSLTISAGVRYDLDGGYTALNSLVRESTGLQRVQTDRDNIAPRFGIAWSPTGSRTTVIRGGIGSYYDETHANVASILLFNGLLVDRGVFIQALDPALNPFWPDTASAQRTLANALAQNTAPALVFYGSPDLEQNLQVPFAVEVSGGASHSLARGLTVSADVLLTRGRDQYVIRDVNIDRDGALSANRIVRLNPNYTFINQYGNGGRFSYRALQVRGAWARGPQQFLNMSYTWARARSNTRTALEGTGGGPYAATNPFNFDEDYGPADHDVRHNVTASGAVMLPLQVQVAGILAARSALPWSATTAQQMDSDPFPDRPESRNARRGDSFFSLDLRLSRPIRLGAGGAATVLVEVFNVTNATNLTAYTAAVTSVNFGQPTNAFDPRRAQVGVRIDF